MRILFTVILIAIILGTFSNVLAETNIDLYGIGAELGFVFPEGDIHNAIGIGVLAKMGTLAPNVVFDSYIDFWGSSRDAGVLDFSWTIIGVGAYVKYQFDLDSKIEPYLGGGLGLDFVHTDFDLGDPFSVVGSESDLDVELAVRLVGGMEMPLDDNLDGFAQFKFSFGEVDYSALSIGVIFKLK